MSGWVGVDLDGTIAHYDGWKGPAEIGAPIPLMVERVRAWLAAGRDVRIFTARISGLDHAQTLQAYEAIEAWCLEHLGQVLPITNVKDLTMVELYDDRCVAVEQNTGRLLSDPQPRFTP